MVRIERPQASRRNSREVSCGIGRVVEETAICVVDDTGRIVNEVRAASEPEALVTVLLTTARRR